MPLPENASGEQRWFEMIVGSVATAITVVETLQRAAMVFDANGIQAMIEAAESGHAVGDSLMSKEQAQALGLLISSFGVYLQTPMVEGAMKPIQVLFKTWPPAIREEA